MNILLTIIAIGIITFSIRLSFIVFFEHMDVPPKLQRALRFVPPAVFSAIIFPELFIRDSGLDISLNNPRLFAGVIAAFIAWRTKSVVLTILAGMASLLIIQALLG